MVHVIDFFHFFGLLDFAVTTSTTHQHKTLLKGVAISLAIITTLNKLSQEGWRRRWWTDTAKGALGRRCAYEPCVSVGLVI